jgi:transcriptional regulator GlxA family with amidase domain
VTALKQTPAPDAETAKRRWDQGLRMLVIEARLQLLEAIRLALAHADEPLALAALANACGGKVRQLEARSG